MTKNEIEINTTSTHRAYFQADRVMLFGQVTEKKKKAYPIHFLKFLFASCTNVTYGFVRHSSQPFTKPKEPFFANTHISK